MTAQILKAADLRYDADAHRTYAPDGSRIPHVTAILAATRLARDFEELGAISHTVADNIAYAGARGHAVHADCHALDDNDLDLAAVDPRILPYVEAWDRCRNDLSLVPLAHGRERYLFHSIYVYAGIQDGVFARAFMPTRRGLRGGLRGPEPIERLRRILIDLKTGDPTNAAGDLQTAAYEAAWNYEHPTEMIDERWAVWLQPGRKRVPYEIINYSAWPDAARHFPTFLAALTVYREQERRFPRVA